jgi:hypothetical protein
LAKVGVEVIATGPHSPGVKLVIGNACSCG